MLIINMALALFIPTGLELPGILPQHFAGLNARQEVIMARRRRQLVLRMQKGRVLKLIIRKQESGLKRQRPKVIQLQKNA